MSVIENKGFVDVVDDYKSCGIYSRRVIITPPTLKLKRTHPYVLKRIKRCVYEPGLINYFLRLMGVCETEMVEAFVCEGTSGRHLDVIPKETGHANYIVEDERLKIYPKIKFIYTRYSTEKKIEFVFKSIEEFEYHLKYMNKHV